jgi:hypothetical protein
MKRGLSSDMARVLAWAARESSRPHGGVFRLVHAVTVEPGVSFLMFPLPRMGYHGLYLGVMARHTKRSLWWAARLGAAGYCVRFVAYPAGAMHELGHYAHPEQYA